jgi:hypothetical protein
MDPQGHDALTDAALDSEIRRALAVDPSPEFRARVRTRIASEPDPAARRLSWMLVAPAVVAVAVVAIVAVSRWPPASTQAPAPLTARTFVGEAALVSPPRTSAQAFRPVLAGRPRTAHVKREPEVLIAADEARALRALIAGVHEGRIVLTPELSAVPATSEPLSVDQIAIDPITITPIAPVTGETGVRQ